MTYTNQLSKLWACLKKPLITIFLFSFAVNVLSLASPIYAMQVFDRVISSGNMYTLFYLTLIALALLVAMGIFSYGRATIQFYMAESFSKAVKPFILSLEMHGRPIKGGIFHVLSDVERIKQFLMGQPLTVLLDIPFVPIFAIAIYLIHPVLLTISIIGCILLFCISLISEMRNKKSQQKMSERVVNQGQFTQNIVRSNETIKALRLQEPLLRAWANKELELLSDVEHTHFGTKFYFEFAKVVRIIIQLFVTAATGYYIVLGEMNPGALMAASVLAGKIIAPFEQIIGIWNNFIQTRLAYNKLQDVIQSYDISDTKISVPSVKGHIKVEELTYSVSQEDKISLLQNISFELNAGECLAIVGPSGSGKSTLLKCLAGVYVPTSGSVRIDGAEISQQFGQIGKSIGFMGSNEDFIATTIKHNISRFDPSLSDEAIIEAARIAGVHEIIMSLPNGYETNIGQGGVHLSSGQKQKIALARALTGRPKILFLDEPNAHLDNAGEMYFMKLLAKLKEHKVTCVIISHKASVLQVADKCALIQDGKLIRFGTPKDVIHQTKETKETAQQTNDEAAPASNSQPIAALK